jgi:hypothetical protein
MLDLEASADTVYSLKKSKQEVLLLFHLVVLLLERVDFAADQLDLLDMPGDCDELAWRRRELTVESMRSMFAWTWLTSDRESANRLMCLHAQ